MNNNKFKNIIMANIGTTYMGLKLKSPVIVGSSSLTASLDNIKKYETAGAGAVVLKSLFEEQILREAASLDINDYPEASDYLNNYLRDNTVDTYLNQIREVKKTALIPIIASINCVKGGDWTAFASKIEEAGADALELNIFFMPETRTQTAQEIEQQYLATAAEVVKAVSVPVAVKISNHFTNPLNIINELYYRGVKGVIMFNRFYEPDINIEKMELGSSDVLSNHVEMRGTQRWIAKASAKIPLVDYAASTGIESGESVVKMLLAGAKAVQVCSAIYKGGGSIIKYMNDFVNEWMVRHGYRETSEFIGKMNLTNVQDSLGYERAQFMKYFSSYK